MPRLAGKLRICVATFAAARTLLLSGEPRDSERLLLRVVSALWPRWSKPILRAGQAHDSGAPSRAGSSWRPYSRRLSGTFGWHRHDLRRAVATLLGDLGFAPHVVSVVLGHAHIAEGATAVYARSRYQREHREALQALADEIDRLVATISCFVAHEERSRKTIRAVRPGIGCRIPNGVVEYGSEPPWAHGPTDLFSAFSVGAEMGSYFNEGWPYPANIICTFAEMMTYHNIRLCKASEGSKEVPNLIDALKYYKLPTIAAKTKNEMRELAIRGPPYTYEELVGLIDYCEADVMACRWLFWTMLKRGHIDLVRAPIRGAFMARLARVEWNGIPIDPIMHRLIRGTLPGNRSRPDGRCEPPLRKANIHWQDAAASADLRADS